MNSVISIIENFLYKRTEGYAPSAAYMRTKSIKSKNLKNHKIKKETKRLEKIKKSKKINLW